jgi:arabinose-5-phosphate isomerase
MLEKTTDFGNFTASDIMNFSPKTVGPDTLVVNALTIMRKNNITQLLVTDKDRYLGVLHLHDILREGII